MAEFPISKERIIAIADERGVTVEQVVGIVSDLTAELPAGAGGLDALTIGGGKTRVPVGKLVGVAAGLLAIFGRRR